jgi:hypothetical protein
MTRSPGWIRVAGSLTVAFVWVAGLTHCGEEGRAARVGGPSVMNPEPPPSAEPDASVPDDELDAGTTPPPDADDGFVKYWDGSTTPTADHVRGVDAGPDGPRGSSGDAGAP